MSTCQQPAQGNDCSYLEWHHCEPGAATFTNGNKFKSKITFVRPDSCPDASKFLRFSCFATQLETVCAADIPRCKPEVQTETNESISLRLVGHVVTHLLFAIPSFNKKIQE